MFRLYWLPDQLSDYRLERDRDANSTAGFYEKKRLLSAFAARKYPVKVRRDGKRISYTKYLMISALALDTSPGACGALSGTSCGIYDRRPLSCRSVPLHYSRAEAMAEDDLDRFVATEGYRCDTGDTAQVLLANGQILASEISSARAEALAIAKADRRWSEAIVRKMSGPSSAMTSLPTLEEVEVNSQSGATTTPMRPAWQIAVDAGLMDQTECERLVAAQLSLIDRELSSRKPSQDARQTLISMREDYRQRSVELVLTSSRQ